MALLGKLFGSDKAIESISSGVDKLFFTKEEKSEQFINTLKAYEPFKLAQRLVALLVTGTYLLMWLISAVLLVVSFWFTELLELSKILAEYNNDTLGLPFTLIVGFYFGGGMAEGMITKFKQKK